MGVIGRIVRPADFERVLAAPQRSRSAHFAVHFLPERPSSARSGVLVAEAKALSTGLSPELSTGSSATPSAAVDDSSCGAPAGLWLGLVIPKRHAKRSVTRNLIKRQIRSTLTTCAAHLPAGLWVVRLRAAFDRQQFRSPASEALRAATREELAVLMERAVRAPLRPPR